jgi:hypothetical protein
MTSTAWICIVQTNGAQDLLMWNWRNRFHPRCLKAIAGLFDEKEPPDFQPEPGHLVACWLNQ